MDQAFWHERWQQNQIGFHAAEFNPHLQNHWPTLLIPKGGKVFVPLCGKSKDLLWLMAEGYEAIGVELSPLAVQAFFAENDLSAREFQKQYFTVHQLDGLNLHCGDFFQLAADDIGELSAVWDRASLVALPPTMRVAYVERMRQLLTPGSRILLVTFDYPQHEMQGPPFCVPSAEVQALYGGWCEVELLSTHDVLDDEPHFRERGFSRLQEQVYKLTVD
ncbi:MAG: thiopurine S-methyltransferase [Methylomonas sp.]|jgi:thiopurine S-methyltransferase|uniref:thiopurine S-methyltransferase n=1 Tax=Methylomonas sp. TaxID=418 RepID=UPI0025E3DD8D|nr:thiopurine S-methyltransferase [Methylomonas sp.]MCK9605336.1 thiopurine S-methyltransferase [Methylomonas sp.]